MWECLGLGNSMGSEGSVESQGSDPKVGPEDPVDGGVPGGGVIAGGFDPLLEPEGALGTAMFPASVGDLLRSFFTSCLITRRGVQKYPYYSYVPRHVSNTLASTITMTFPIVNRSLKRHCTCISHRCPFRWSDLGKLLDILNLA